MDSVTQAALGAAIGDVCLGSKLGNKAMLVGAAVATIPDLDVLLLPLYNEIQRISIHRGYSHSILLSIVGAVVLAWIFKRTSWGKAIDIKAWIWSLWLMLITHMLLDAFTSYGTQLFLPFSDYRMSFDSISIVDPAYTLPLLLGLILSGAFRSRRKKDYHFSRYALIVSSLYLCLTIVVKQQVSSEGKSQLTAQDIRFIDFRTVPVNAGISDWYVIATTTDSLYLAKHEDLKKSPPKFFSFPINSHLLQDENPELVERLIWFAQGFYTVSESSGHLNFYNLQCDMQGPLMNGNLLAPTAWHFTITKDKNGDTHLGTDVHLSE
jgi:inner membrane protein